MFGWLWLIDPLRAWSERRHRQRVIKMASGERDRVWARLDWRTADYWAEVIDELKSRR
jgi:hypothetical protein